MGVLSLAGESGSVSLICGAAGAWVSTVKDRDTNAPTFPGAPIALTKRVWEPSGSRGAVKGELQGLGELASTRQTKVEPASLEAKEKLGVGSFVGPVGPRLMRAWGAVVSAVKPLKVLYAGFGVRS